MITPVQLFLSQNQKTCPGQVCIYSRMTILSFFAVNNLITIKIMCKTSTVTFQAVPYRVKFKLEEKL
jgi:hypothetical protein